eukprot:4108826-Pyramimonas_sp.AAC.2
MLRQARVRALFQQVGLQGTNLITVTPVNPKSACLVEKVFRHESPRAKSVHASYAVICECLRMTSGRVCWVYRCSIASHSQKKQSLHWKSGLSTLSSSTQAGV